MGNTRWSNSTDEQRDLRVLEEKVQGESGARNLSEREHEGSKSVAVEHPTIINHNPPIGWFLWPCVHCHFMNVMETLGTMIARGDHSCQGCEENMNVSIFTEKPSKWDS